MTMCLKWLNNFLADILYLDEPTNHLDFSTKRIVSDILEDYPGTIIMVSHDRYFVNRVANKVIYLHNKEFIIEEGNYDDFCKKHDLTTESFTYLTSKEHKEQPKKETKKVPSNKEKNKLEKEIELLMNELDLVNEKLNDQEKTYNWIEYKELHDKVAELEEKIEEKMLKLENLSG